MQRAVLTVMAAGGDRYAPFESDTLEKYNAAIEKARGKAVTVDVPGVQQALAALQGHGLVWKAARGVYSIEDTTLTDVMREQGMLEGIYPDAESVGAESETDSPMRP